MIRACAVAAWIVMAGCQTGGAEDPSLPRGTVLGEAFAPVSGGAVWLDTASCPPSSGYPEGSKVAALLVGFYSFADGCGLIAQTDLCGERPDSIVARVALVRQGPVGAPIERGDYGGYTHDPVTDDQTFLLGDVATYGSACEPTDASITGLHLEIDELGDAAVRGTVEIDMAPDEPYEGPFEVPLCPFTPADPCGLLLGLLDGSFCPDPACIPG